MQTGPDDRKRDAVYRLLLADLYGGVYRFGDPIPVKATSERIGVSRQPVMAALSRLAAEGIVTITAQVGCQVIAPSPTEIGDFFLLFSRCEGLMAELAAARATEREIATMRAANRRIAALAADDGQAYRELNRAFHAAVHLGSHSPRLTERTQSAWAMSDFLVAQTYGFLPHLRHAAIEHEAIVTAIAARDGARARQASEAHILSVSHLVTGGGRQRGRARQGDREGDREIEDG